MCSPAFAMLGELAWQVKTYLINKSFLVQGVEMARGVGFQPGSPLLCACVVLGVWCLYLLFCLFLAVLAGYVIIRSLYRVVWLVFFLEWGDIVSNLDSGSFQPIQGRARPPSTLHQRLSKQYFTSLDSFRINTPQKVHTNAFNCLFLLTKEYGNISILNRMTETHTRY